MQCVRILIHIQKRLVNAMLELRCPKHTGYKGINLPTTECEHCNRIRALRLGYWYLVKNYHQRRRRMPTERQIRIVEAIQKAVNASE